MSVRDCLDVGLDWRLSNYSFMIILIVAYPYAYLLLGVMGKVWALVTALLYFC